MFANDWDSITASELRVAARVARACGGTMMAAAAAAWEFRANVIETGDTDRICE